MLRVSFPGCSIVAVALGACVWTATVFAVPFEWQTVAPESEGVSSTRIAKLVEHLRARNTEAFLLARNDRLLVEWYAPERSAATKFGTASAAKALAGGLAVAVALDDGRLKLDDPAAKFIPQWRADPVKSKITLRQLGSHTSGLGDAEDNGRPHAQLTGWAGDFWKRLPPPRDPFTLSREAAPMVSAPGAEWHYSNPGIAMLAFATTAALRGTPHADIRALLRERVFRPIGIGDQEWSVATMVRRWSRGCRSMARGAARHSPRERPRASGG